MSARGDLGSAARLSRPQMRVCRASISPPSEAAAARTSAWKRAGGRCSVWNASLGANTRRQLRSCSCPSSGPAASTSLRRSAAARPVHPPAGAFSAHSTCAARSLRPRHRTPWQLATSSIQGSSLSTKFPATFLHPPRMQRRTMA